MKRKERVKIMKLIEKRKLNWIKSNPYKAYVYSKGQKRYTERFKNKREALIWAKIHNKKIKSIKNKSKPRQKILDLSFGRW